MPRLSAVFKSRVGEFKAHLILISLIVIFLGSGALGQAIPFIRVEAETGTVNGQANSVSDSSASGGLYLGFSQASLTTSFLETFDGTPTNPEPWNNLNWDVSQMTRNSTHWENPDEVDAHHAFHNCGDVATGGAHTIRTWPETVFKCNGHVMTSINGEPGYAAIYLSPPAMADFSTATSTIGFDVSTFMSSGRDWVDVFITPFGDAMSYPLDIDVDGSGMPRNGIHVRQEGINQHGAATWQIQITRNGQTEVVGALDIPYSGFGGPSRVTRTPVKIVVGVTSLTVSYPTVPGATRTFNYEPLSWNRGIVQFGHHSYTPLKDCSDNPQFLCEAGTWHWDNISINPARNFYQLQATPERTGGPIRNDSNPRTITFGEAAPPNAVLVFSGSCGIDFRDNASAPWRQSTVVGSRANLATEHVQSYSVNVPQGSSSIQYRFVDNGGYHTGLGCQLANPTVKALQ